MDFGSVRDTKLESSEELLELKPKLPVSGFVLPSDDRAFEQRKTYLGTSTSLFTDVLNTRNPMKESPKDSIAFGRSLHQSARNLSDRIEMKPKTWRETTKCPSEQDVQLGDARQLAKTNENFSVVVSFRHQQNSSNMQYILLDKACLPGGEKAFYFHSLCPSCGCFFSQFKAILVHYLGEQGNKMKPSKDRSWIQNVEMWDSEDGTFLQLGNPWKTHKGYKILLYPTGVKTKDAVPQMHPTATQGAALETRENPAESDHFLENLNERCVENHLGLDEIRLIAKNKIGYRMMVKLGAKRSSGWENTQIWHFLASVECLPGGKEAGAFKSWCPHCGNYFRDFTAIFRHYVGPEYVARVKPSKRQGWVREVEIWDGEKEDFKRYPNPWKEESNKKKRLLSFLPQVKTSDQDQVKRYRSDQYSATEHYESSTDDNSATALHCAETLPLTAEYRNYTADHNIFPEESTNVGEENEYNNWEDDTFAMKGESGNKTKSRRKQRVPRKFHSPTSHEVLGTNQGACELGELDEMENSPSWHIV